MKSKTEKKIKYWVSTLVKIFAITFLVVRAYDYFSTRSERKIESTEKIESTKSSAPSSKSLMVDQDSSDSLSSAKNLVKETVVGDMAHKQKDLIELSKIVKFQGHPLPNAKIIVDNCPDCKISDSKTNGLVTFLVPKKVYAKNYLHNFYVYSNDTLLFERAMRFTDVQFNIY